MTVELETVWGGKTQSSRLPCSPAHFPTSSPFSTMEQSCMRAVGPGNIQSGSSKSSGSSINKEEFTMVRFLL